MEQENIVYFKKYEKKFLEAFEKRALEFVDRFDDYLYDQLEMDGSSFTWEEVVGSEISEEENDDWCEYFIPMMEEIEMKIFGRIVG